MKTRTLHITRSLDPATGGPAEVARLLALACAEAGHAIEVATLDAPDAPWLRDFPAKVHAFSGRGGFGFAPSLVGWLRENDARFDAVVAHGLWQFQSLAAWMALRGGHVPWFVFPHGMLDENFKSITPGKHRKQAVYWRLLESRIARDASALLFTCEEERRLAQNTFRPYAAREEIVTLGVEGLPAPRDDLAAQFFEKFPQLRGGRLLLFLGRLHPKKGCDLLLEAFARLKPPLHLVLAGPCDDAAFLARLKELAQDQPATFAGMLRGRDKWAALAAAEAFILPSHQENFGIAVAEALATGVPVLISNKVNIWREIEQDGAGFVETDNADGAASLLSRWLAADRDTMSAAARGCFEQRFHVRVMAAQFTALVGKFASC